MSSKPTAVELDFLGLDKENTTTSPASSTSSKSQLRRFYDRQNSFREVQNAIAKINPELLKAGVCSRKSISVPRSPNPRERPAEAAPLTIFYNGTVAVFDLPQDKAETILKFVDDGWFKKRSAADQEHKLSTTKNYNWLAHLSKRRMLQRNVSLQRFLEKRKERLTAMPNHISDGKQKKTDNNVID